MLYIYIYNLFDFKISNLYIRQTNTLSKRRMFKKNKNFYFLKRCNYVFKSFTLNKLSTNF